MNSENNNMPGEESAGESTLSFEEAMRELEEIVEMLEEGSAPLDESIALVRRGQELAAQCDDTLKQAELALSTLIATEEGELVEEELDWEVTE